ncbi:MAG: SIS domain-containing protein [Halobacteriovoraceae bacterium]|nr:SIS domain-containing protein [Halobacteriovoraceae bacterium]
MKVKGQLMKFPIDKNFETFSSNFNGYIETLRHVASQIKEEDLNKLFALVCEVIDQGKTIFSIGNGGSCAISNHLKCDFYKGLATDTGLMPKVRSLSTDLPLMTALANDISYDEVFNYQVQRDVSQGDMLLAISSSGNSENILRALETAKKKEAKTVLFCGFSGGKGKDIADLSIHTKVENYGITEDLHQSLMHTLAQFARLKNLQTDCQVENIKF